MSLCPFASRSKSIYSSCGNFRIHLFFHLTGSCPPIFPTHLFALLSVSNVIYSSPNSFQVHIFFRPSISKSTYSHTTLFLNPTTVFEGIYFYIHPFLSNLLLYGVTPGREKNPPASRFSGDDVSATVATLKCRGSYQ